MTGTKRMSAEEKRQTILAIYHKSKQVYTEKEIHTLAAKAGVNTNSFPEVNQSLVDDGLVDKEKIGGSNYFWSFPAKRDRTMQLKHEQTLRELEELKSRVAAAEVRLADAKRGREDDDGERAKKLARLGELAKERQAVEEELETLKENDPQALADLEKELEYVKQAAFRWTDNIFACKAYLTKKRGIDSKEACKYLQITSAFDYPEDKFPK